MIKKEEYLEAIKLIDDYENAMVLNNGIPCFILIRNEDKHSDNNIQVFTDEDMANRQQRLHPNSKLIISKLYEPNYEILSHNENQFNTERYIFTKLWRR